MGYADGYYYGQGRIICDTSTFSVGDTIRVRSVYNALQTEDKQVVTVGTPLIFTVPPYDTYKVCQIQEINNVVTEIGGVEVNIGFGDFVNTTPLDTNSLAYVQSVLNNHQENYLLNIGDEKTIKINEGGTPKDIVFQLAGINVYNSHEAIFTSKVILSTSQNGDPYSSSALRTKAQTFYSNIDDRDKQYIKNVTRQYLTSSLNVGTYSDYCYVLGNKEITGSTAQASSVPAQQQLPLFVTQANRIKTLNGTASAYWTADSGVGSGGTYRAIYINSSGSSAFDYATNNFGFVPSFTLLADS